MGQLVDHPEEALNLQAALLNLGDAQGPLLPVRELLCLVEFLTQQGLVDDGEGSLSLVALHLPVHHSDVNDLRDESQELVMVVELLKVVNECSHAEAGEDCV